MRITIDTGDDKQAPTEATSSGVVTASSVPDHDGGPAAHSTEPGDISPAAAPAPAITVYDGGAASAGSDALVAATGDDVVSQFSGGEHKDLHGDGSESALDGGSAAGDA